MDLTFIITLNFSNPEFMTRNLSQLLFYAYQVRTAEQAAAELPRTVAPIRYSDMQRKD